MSQDKIYDFTVPQRQSIVVLILIIFKTIRIFFRQFGIPVILTYLIGREQKDEFGDFFIRFLIGITLISTISSLISYFRKKYYVDEDELIVNSGLFSKKQISIRFERIQSIGFEQNLIHKILGVKKVKIDTAGSAEKELELDGLENDKAEALRNLLLSNKAAILNNSNKNENIILEESEIKNETNSTTILQLNFLDLLKAGIFENHLSSAVLILAFGWSIYTSVSQYGVEPEDYVDKVPRFYSYLEILSILFTMIGIVITISLARTILNYYNLNFSRIQNGFKINKGLFNTLTISAMDNKIQTISWSNNLLKKIVKIYDIKMKQANTKNVKTNESIIIAGAKIEHLDKVLNFLYPNEDIRKIKMNKVDVAYFNRRLLFSFILALIVIILGNILQNFSTFLFGCSLLFILPYLFERKYHKIAYGFNDEIIKIEGGIFGESNLVSQIYKIQSIEKTQSPYQRKKGLVTLILNNASGKEAIPYINENDANKILNLFLKKIETDKRSWM